MQLLAKFQAKLHTELEKRAAGRVRKPKFNRFDLEQSFIYSVNYCCIYIFTPTLALTSALSRCMRPQSKKYFTAISAAK
jgi:hypothetical protein